MSTKLPAAVQRQLEEADRLTEEAAASAAPLQEPTPPSAEPPPAPVAEPPPAAPTGEDWQHKFLTLQGKYNTETAALRRTVEDLTKQVEELKAKPPTPEPATPPDPAPKPKLITEADVEAFGSDLVDLMRRVAREEDGPSKDSLLAEITELKKRIPTLERATESAAEHAVDVKRSAYFAKLAELVPDYEAINTDEAFLGWLTGADPLSGLVRNAMLQTAFAGFDHARTAAIFRAFKQDTGRALTPMPPAAEPAPPKDGLDAQVSPAGTKSSSPAAASEKKTWTSAEIHEFYTAVTRGDYRGRADEARRLDAEIDQALAEGRVQG